MQKRFRRFQHLLTAIPVFESAARLGSFTKAATELGLTQPTVSRHIMHLEEQLGLPLFSRQHNRISLTNAGAELSDAIALGFSHIDSVIRSLSPPTHNASVTIGCSFEFSSHWLCQCYTPSISETVCVKQLQASVSRCPGHVWSSAAE